MEAEVDEWKEVEVREGARKGSRSKKVEEEVDE